MIKRDLANTRWILAIVTTPRGPIPGRLYSDSHFCYSLPGTLETAQASQAFDA